MHRQIFYCFLFLSIVTFGTALAATTRAQELDGYAVFYPNGYAGDCEESIIEGVKVITCTARQAWSYDAASNEYCPQFTAFQLDFNVSQIGFAVDKSQLTLLKGNVSDVDGLEVVVLPLGSLDDLTVNQSETYLQYRSSSVFTGQTSLAVGYLSQPIGCQIGGPAPETIVTEVQIAESGVIDPQCVAPSCIFAQSGLEVADSNTPLPDIPSPTAAGMGMVSAETNASLLLIAIFVPLFLLGTFVLRRK